MPELTGRVLHAGDPGWDEARRGYCARIDYDSHPPRVIVFCQDTQDVANAVRWARANRVLLRVRSGRHDYEGFSSLVRDGIIVDTSEVSGLWMDRATGLITAGAGIDMLRLVEALWEMGVTVPTATGASVGLAGLVLGGGFGVTSRKFGLTCDNLINVQLVTAGGEIINANERDHSDLLWACCGGGGGNFGVATAFTLKTHRVSLVAAFTVSWPWEQLEAVVKRWQTWANEVEDGVTSFLRLTVARRITLFGQFTAEERDLPRAAGLLQPMVAGTTPTEVTVQVAPFIGAARLFFDVDPLRPLRPVKVFGEHEIYKSTSAIAYTPFDAAAISALRQQLEAAPVPSVPPREPSMIQLLGGGGAPSRIPLMATAVAHRQARFVVQYNAFWTAPQDAQPTLDWVMGSREAMLPYTSGAYVNYTDASIEDWPRAYYGANLERLVRVKRNYDPENVFNFAQSIPLTLDPEHQRPG